MGPAWLNTSQNTLHSGRQLLTLTLKALFSCNHARALAVEGKTYCPDCGCGLVFRWVVLKCQHCGQRRSAQYRLRQIYPQESCCTFCGEPDVETRVLEEPAFYQLRFALLVLEEAPPPISVSMWHMVFHQWTVFLHWLLPRPEAPELLASLQP